MGIPNFTSGYPPDGSSLGETKATIRDNLDGTFQVFSVDHQDQNETNAGYHSVIHWKAQGADPGNVAGTSQEYAKTDSNSIQQKYLKSTGNNIYQETRMIDSQFAKFGARANGWTYLPGNLILQWGSTTTVQSSSGITVLFPFQFPNAVYSVTTSIVTNDNSTIRFAILNDANTLGFSTTQTSSSHFTRLYWMAIGS